MPYKDLNSPVAKANRKEINARFRKNNPQYYKEAYKRWAKEHPEKLGERRRKYLSNPQNRIKANARTLVGYALRTGKLTRPGSCSQCGVICKPEADHSDYARPYDITWLCKLCHVAVGLARENK